MKLVSGTETFGELAHILPAMERGPRGSENSDVDPASTDNIVLLCANCHTIVDKAPEEFPVAILRGWQEKHVRKLEEAFGSVVAESREQCRGLVSPLLLQNRSVFVHYGPSPERSDLGEEPVRVWRRKVREIVIPNNRRILALCDANRSLLEHSEIPIVELLRQHNDDLEARHFRGEVETSAIRFPEAMEYMFS